MTVSDIRLGRHDGFDRVVFEVGGTGTPGWDVRYVDEASSQGSGDAVEVAGDAVLQVTLTGVGYPYATGVEEYTGGPLTAAGTEVVTEVVWDATFEGTSVAFVGTGRETPFRVYALDEPGPRGRRGRRRRLSQLQGGGELDAVLGDARALQLQRSGGDALALAVMLDPSA